MAATYNPKQHSVNDLLRNEFWNELPKVRKIYDGSNRLIYEIRTFSAAEVGSAALAKTYQYDASGNQTASKAITQEWTQEDEDEAVPTITNMELSVSTVVDGSTDGTVIGTLTTVGGAERYTYTIVDDPDNKFKITSLDKLTVADTIDITDVSHQVKVRVEDGNKFTFEKTFTITIVTPTFLQNDNSLLFDGVDEYVTFGDHANAKFERTDAFSLSVWFRPGSGSNNMSIVQKLTASTQFRGYEVLYNAVSDRIEFNIISDSSGGDLIQVRSSNSSVVANTWYHICVTYDGSSTAAGAKIYINGALNSSTVVDALTATIVSTAELTIGARIAGSVTSLVDGHVDEFSIYDKELSLTEVQEIYNSGTPLKLNALTTAPNLISWYRMGDEAIFPTIPDQDGAVDGTMTNMEAGDIVAEVP